MENKKDNDLTEIISHALDEMKHDFGEKFNPDHINLAELQRRTGISRSKLRRISKTGFIDKPHALTGRKAETTILSGFSGIIDAFLAKGITNSSVCLERLQENGYPGGLTTVKDYIKAHQDLIPAKRQIIASQESRGQRYQTLPGEAYQMDWGFVDVETESGATYKVACFAMICHCCGQRYIEFPQCQAGKSFYRNDPRLSLHGDSQVYLNGQHEECCYPERFGGASYMAERL